MQGLLENVKFLLVPVQKLEKEQTLGIHKLLQLWHSVIFISILIIPVYQQHKTPSLSLPARTSRPAAVGTLWG